MNISIDNISIKFGMKNSSSSYNNINDHRCLNKQKKLTSPPHPLLVICSY
ncbi:MAG TPA: hypothetical protein VE076_00165 [Nitrososphaeraceae archaeon]|nr:hypothetical protein [Nitrososphaeraceae archaeon]